ncbi:uncharacterized protein EI90DRAFT_1745991 [Cantharellus anzutake]|uniref:uncharacterized protein n=1 Tax=Cantharellus anzutake TaxID=1750568 RepID=UPI001903D6F1|nr:uncharacterized protein EI90DRAFT_1745991 [Cantharellus anzutake]KAF8341507.1 hypothetical protein EI90DRAFT_1745991 [Cantharellus anzutake]
MARTNAWAWLEKVHDKDLLGYNDFSQYIKNLKGFESLMHAGDSLQHSLVNDEGATGPQVKVIHRMFESCWDTIRVTTTPQQDIEAKLKMRYKLTPGDHPVAVRLANSKSPSCSGTVTPLDDPLTLQTERTTPPTEPSTPENKAKALPELGGYDDSSDDESVHGFLGPEFGLEHWPVVPENIDLRDKMFEEKRWQTNPLRAYREGIEGVIAPSEYATALPGATVQMSFTLACHLIGSRTGKKTTFSARVEEIIILKKPATLVSNRTDCHDPAFPGARRPPP